MHASKVLDTFWSNCILIFAFFYISGANLDESSAANIVIKANILPPNLYVTLEKRKEKMWREKFKSWILWHIQNCYSFTMPMTMAEMKCALLLNSKYANSLVNADSFYANFTNTFFQNKPSNHEISGTSKTAIPLRCLWQWRKWNVPCYWIVSTYLHT